MLKQDIFGDNRKIPQLTINVKVKVKTESVDESMAWNKAFGYIMKKPRTKLEFLLVNDLRKLQLNNIKLNEIREYLSEEDIRYLEKIELLFDDRLPLDVKAFVLSVLRIPSEILITLSQK